MIKLQSEIREFTHIVHLADIQIRLTKRHDEYREVFARLFEQIKALPDTTVICVVGDIVHSKLDLSPECVQLTKEFFLALANLRPVVLVAGNHDTNLTNKSRLDSLSPIVEAINHPQLYYLKNSGLYSLGDICFNNYSVFDDVYTKATDIPDIYKNEYRHFICLFHGTVDGAVSEMGFKLVNKSAPLSLFDGHDIVLLGDIHKLQDLQEYSTTKPAVHYCGSLIQQNHGEDLENHGYTLWDLKTRNHQHVDVPNDYGYFTVKVDKGEVITDLQKIPKKARVRLSCFESLPTETKAVIKELKKITTLVEPPTYTREITKEQEKGLATLGVNLVQGDLNNRDHQIKLITEFLKKKLNVTDDETINTIIKINDETNEEFQTDDVAKNVKWSLIKFEWDNLFSFGEENVIDFTKLKDIVGLFASNASGKSSVFSALSWCIFDKCEREFKANNIINDQKMSCRALLEVDIGGVRHFIERTGKMDKKGAVKVNVRFWKVNGDKEEELTGVERSDTNNAIRAHMGNYEDFLLTSLSVQKSGKYETSFIDLGDSGRKDLLAQFMGLTVFDRLHEVANKKLNEIISTLKVYKNEDFEGDLKNNTDTLSQVELASESENKTLSDLQNEKEQVQKQITENSSRIVEIKGCRFTSKDELQKSINEATTAISSSQELHQPLIELQTKCNDRMVQLGNTIKEMEETKVNEVYSNWQKLVVEKNNIVSTISQKVIEAKSYKEKAKRLDDYKFDPDCKYCIKNADTVTLEAVEANDKLVEYKDIVANFMEEKKILETKIEENINAEAQFKTYNECLKDKNRIQEEYLGAQNKIDRILQKIDKSKELLTSLTKEKEMFEQNEESIKNNSEIKRVVESLKQRLQNVSYEENKQNTIVKTLIGKTSVLKAKIEDAKCKIEKVKSIEKIYHAYDLYVQSVCRDGIPYEVICVAVPHIESEVNSILSQVVDFHAKFDVDGKNIIPFIVYDERKWLMSLGSGMEQFILSTAIRVALTNLSNLPKMNGMVIDEGFGVLDPEHLSTISNLFHYLKSNFDFIIIISHLDVMRDLVDNHIEIKKDAGFSKVNFI